MSLFQRIRTPFSEPADEPAGEAAPPGHVVGALLRERREELGLDLDTIGEILRIKSAYLAALERGRAQDLPGPTYASGFIRAYARHLGLDSERVLERYKAASSEVRARPDLSLPVPLGSRSIPGGPIVLVALIVALCGYGTWYYMSTGERSRPVRVSAVPAQLEQAVQHDAAATAAVSAPPPVATPPTAPIAAGPHLSSGLTPPADGSPAEEPVAASPANPSAAADQPVAPLAALAPPNAPAVSEAKPAAPAQIVDATATAGQGIDIRAVTDCWIQVRTADDQSIVFSRVLKAGESYHVPRTGLLLRTGNAGALAIVVDGKPAPAIGGIGTLRRSVALDPAALLAGTAVHG